MSSASRRKLDLTFSFMENQREMTWFNTSVNDYTALFLRKTDGSSLMALGEWSDLNCQLDLMVPSSYVRPPIVVSDVSRPKPMTVEWSSYAQSITQKPMKGMLTGPVTILNWSFPREDVPRKLQSQQLALSLRDEVLDLEAAGIAAIQVDEPAIREGVSLFTR